MPAWISNEEIHGPIPNAQYNALQVWGSYNNALIIKSNYMPRYYAALVATGGPNSDSNPVGFREHVNTAHQGLRHIPGAGRTRSKRASLLAGSIPVIGSTRALRACPSTVMPSRDPVGRRRYRPGIGPRRHRTGHFEAVLLHDHRVADVDRVEVPLRVLGAQADAAVADILVSERIDCPRSRMHEKATAGDPYGVIDRELVTVGSRSTGMPTLLESMSTERSLASTV